jgi:hypothetical protein
VCYGRRSRSGGHLRFLVEPQRVHAIFFDVVVNRDTEVTALFDLAVDPRELRAQAKSPHFWVP